MNWQRKFKRDKSHHKPKNKILSKLSFKSIVIFIGTMMACFGAFYGAYSHHIYVSGDPEHATQTAAGPQFHPEEEPGNPAWKDSTVICFIIAGFGIVLIIITLIASEIFKYLKPARKKPVNYRQIRLKKI